MPRRVLTRGHSRADGSRVLVLGGTSEIGLAIVRRLQARSPREVALVGRDPASLARAAESLKEAGAASVTSLQLDARDTDRHAAGVAEAVAALGGADIVILAVGVLGTERGVPADVAEAVDVLEVNLAGSGSLLLHAARALREQGSGTLVVLSSVAGDRVRPANLVYGASKAGLDGLAQGLDHALAQEGVRVVVVRPGFVHTKMTRGLAPAPLSTTPEAVAALVERGLDRGAHTVWAPPALRWVALALRIMPRWLFRRLPM